LISEPASARTTTPARAADQPVSPYVTLLGFGRYIARTGPAKASFVGGLRRQRESRSGFNPHGPLVKALKADIQFRTPGIHLSQVIDLVKPRWRPLYEALVPGALTYLGSLGDLTSCYLVRPRDVLVPVGSLPVKLNTHFGVRHVDGTAEIVRLHFDEEPPAGEAVLATLRLLERYTDQILPGGVPVLVDLRRGRIHRPDRAAKPEQVDQWLAGEAAAFTAIWDAAA
jgi:hypothetical protein